MTEHRKSQPKRERKFLLRAAAAIGGGTILIACSSEDIGRPAVDAGTTVRDAAPGHDAGITVRDAGAPIDVDAGISVADAGSSPRDGG